MRVIGLFVAAALVAACTRDPTPALCPMIGNGDLVISEFRGPQSPVDMLGVWVELYNASSATIDLEGLEVRFRRKDGSSEVDVLVRRSVVAAVGGYVVLGLVNDDANRPSYIDYGFASDFDQTFLAAAAVDLDNCGALVDRAVYDSLPSTGTYSLGINPPNAIDNDVPASWCTSDIPDGTPQQANPPCP